MAYFVGLSYNEFMHMTPLEIHQAQKFIIKRIKFENELADRRTARICCVLANINRKKHSKAFKEEDFLPKKKKSRKERQMNVNDIATTLKMLTIMNGGTIIR